METPVLLEELTTTADNGTGSTPCCGKLVTLTGTFAAGTGHTCGTGACLADACKTELCNTVLWVTVVKGTICGTVVKGIICGAEICGTNVDVAAVSGTEICGAEIRGTNVDVAAVGGTVGSAVVETVIGIIGAESWLYTLSGMTGDGVWR